MECAPGNDEVALTEELETSGRTEAVPPGVSCVSSGNIFIWRQDSLFFAALTAERILESVLRGHFSSWVCASDRSPAWRACDLSCRVQLSCFATVHFDIDVGPAIAVRHFGATGRLRMACQTALRAAGDVPAEHAWAARR